MKNSTIVLVVLIILVGAGLYVVSTRSGTNSSTGTVATTTDTNTDTGTGAPLHTYQSTHVTLKYSSDFTLNDVSTSGPTDWRINAAGNPGTLDLSLMLPQSFAPQTNFGDAKLTVGESADAKAVAGCLTPDQSGGGGPSMTTKVINGVSFTVFTFSDAGAGNLYDSTSYRTVHNGLCFAAEYTIHSSQIANYPPSAGISAFDEAAVKAELDQVVGTITLQ